MKALLHATVTILRDKSLKTQLNRHLRYTDHKRKHNGVWRLWGLRRPNNETESATSCSKTIINGPAVRWKTACLSKAFQAAIKPASIRKRSPSLGRIEVAAGEDVARCTRVIKE